MIAALGSAHVSVSVMRETQRVALSGMPATEMPVVTAPLRFLELAVDLSHAIGSRFFFLCHVVFDENPAGRRKP